MKNITFISILLLSIFLFPARIYSQNDNNVGISQGVFASNINPVQVSRSNRLQNQAQQNFEMQNPGNLLNNSLNNSFEQVQTRDINNASETGQFQLKQSNGIGVSLELPSISLKNANRAKGSGGFSKTNNKEKPLRKLAFKVNKKMKKNFRKKTRNGKNSLNGCFSW